MCILGAGNILDVSYLIYVSMHIHVHVHVGRASRLECVRRGFKSHLRCSSFSLEKSCLRVCVVLCCFVFLSV